MGLTLGLLVAVEVLPIISFAPLTVAYLLSKPSMRERRRLVPLVAGLAIPLVLHAIINVGQTGDVLPGGFHSELFNYEGSRFDSSTLTGNINHASVRELLSYSWRALFSVKGYFSYAPTLLAGLLSGLFGWKLWRNAIGVFVILFGGTALSLTASLLMTNNFGGFAAGFRHATYLSPALLLLLLPILTNSSAAARRASALVVAGSIASALTFFLVMTPRPFYPYTFPPAAKVGRWDQYVPVVAHVVRRISGTVDEFGKPMPIHSTESAQ
jgi:hypothetical protein